MCTISYAHAMNTSSYNEIGGNRVFVTRFSEYCSHTETDIQM